MVQPVTRMLLSAAAAALGLALSASLPGRAAEQPVYVTTIAPFGMILRELVGNRAEVEVLLPPGASPHTYDPKPSEVKVTSEAAAFFYGGELLDGWAADLPCRKRVELFALVPDSLKLPMPAHHHHEDEAGHAHSAEQGHEHEGESALDPHFWTSPRVVRAMLPGLVEELCACDPVGTETYRAQGRRFDAVLQELDRELTSTLAGVKGRHMLLFHPSFGYLMHDYGLERSGVIELIPGQEPSPQLIAELVETAKRDKVAAVFSEPQLPAAPAQTIARETGLALVVLDPIGGTAGRTAYPGLLRYNARMIANAFIGK
jgi:zinc transport system substrate-binding protein